MNCEQASSLFEQVLAEPTGAERQRVMHHLSACADCRHAFRALAYLRAERDLPVPDPAPGALDEALRAAIANGRRRVTGSFWSGVAVGALAAGVAGLALAFLLEARILESPIFKSAAAPRALPPEITLALHRSQELRIAIDAPQAIPEAEIHVRLRGAVDLDGYAGERDIRWTTRLERGINELRLPVSATGEEGGQVRVVVRHGDRQKSFTIDVRVAREAVEPAEPASV